MALLASNGFFHKKSRWIFDFCLTWRSFCWRKTYSGYFQISRASFAKMDEPIQIFCFVINGLHVFGNNFFFEKKPLLHNFVFFSFLSNCYLVSLMSGHTIHYRCLTKLQSNISWGQNIALWLPKHFLASVNWFFVRCLFVVLFVTASKIEYRQFLNPFYRSIGNGKPMGYFSWFLMVFITLKINFF